jgi:hypothetical protein
MPLAEAPGARRNAIAGLGVDAAGQAVAGGREQRSIGLEAFRQHLVVQQETPVGAVDQQSVDLGERRLGGELSIAVRPWLCGAPATVTSPIRQAYALK